MRCGARTGMGTRSGWSGLVWSGLVAHRTRWGAPGRGAMHYCCAVWTRSAQCQVSARARARALSELRRCCGGGGARGTGTGTGAVLVQAEAG
ncbi:hypothetical protein CALCODRAFT_163713 [Calocera cornea HHB12733]|uniref:Uncharacterized protein n=1 Tax=Calocera cornea HHB12733 TaxID=1353952 RepID=A0A165CJJ6_9BASI|nr:hypothetical protein CALCODRAFT_163713 [Calocera cornea HHB12733]